MELGRKERDEGDGRVLGDERDSVVEGGVARRLEVGDVGDGGGEEGPLGDELPVAAKSNCG